MFSHQKSTNYCCFSFYVGKFLWYCFCSAVHLSIDRYLVRLINFGFALLLCHNIIIFKQKSYGDKQCKAVNFHLTSLNSIFQILFRSWILLVQILFRFWILLYEPYRVSVERLSIDLWSTCIGVFCSAFITVILFISNFLKKSVGICFREGTHWGCNQSQLV